MDRVLVYKMQRNLDKMRKMGIITEEEYKEEYIKIRDSNPYMTLREAIFFYKVAASDKVAITRECYKSRNCHFIITGGDVITEIYAGKEFATSFTIDEIMAEDWVLVSI